MSRSSRGAKLREWIERLERFSGSGLTAAKFCRAEKISLPSFYQWKRKLTQQANPASESTRGPSAFAALELKPTAPAMTTIRLPNGVAIEFVIEFSSDRHVLQRWLQQLLEQATKPGSASC